MGISGSTVASEYCVYSTTTVTAPGSVDGSGWKGSRRGERSENVVVSWKETMFSKWKKLEDDESRSHLYSTSLLCETMSMLFSLRILFSMEALRMVR